MQREMWVLPDHNQWHIYSSRLSPYSIIVVFLIHAHMISVCKGSSHSPKASIWFWQQILMLFNNHILTSLVAASAADRTIPMDGSVFCLKPAMVLNVMCHQAQLLSPAQWLPLLNHMWGGQQEKFQKTSQCLICRVAAEQLRKEMHKLDLETIPDLDDAFCHTSP